MPFGGGIPAVADMNGDGIDDLVQMFFTVYSAINAGPVTRFFRLRFCGAQAISASGLPTRNRLWPILTATADWTFISTRAPTLAVATRIRASGTPIVADVDGEGLVEVVAVGSDGILRVIGSAWPQ